MKKRKLKKWFKNLIFILVIYSIGISFMFCLSNRLEKLDQKKELSTPTVQNVYR